MNSSRSEIRIAGGVLSLVGLLMVGTLVHNQPNKPVGRGAPPAEFSAERAVDALARILTDEKPHPTGSAENRAVRLRLEAEIKRIGYAPEVRTHFSCSAAGTCATVENVFTKLPGKSGGPGVLLIAHYDSVPAGPGASDDGSGVATLLEVARALRAQAGLKHDVWFLFTDGEEMGLLGAEAFVREPEFKQIGIAINFEARGTTGRSRLIETSNGNAGLIAQLRASVDGPSADSLTYEIYKTLPNDTDLTVFRRTGIPSLGFAYADGAARYHTTRDDLEHLDRGSLQGHGDHALGLAREFATNGVRKSDHDVVFFDLFGTLVVWPQTYNAALLAIGLVGLGALLVRLRKKEMMRWSRFFIALAINFGLVIGALLLGIGLRLALAALGAVPAAWTAQGNYLVAAFLLAPIAMLALVASPLTRRFSPHAFAAASFIPFAAIATLTVLKLPGGSFVGLAPLLVGVIVANLWPERPVLWGGALAIAATPIFFNIAAAGYGGLGEAALPGAPLVLSLGLLPLLAVFAALTRAGRALGALALIGCLAAVAGAAMRPAFTRDTPAGTMLMFVSRPEGDKLYAFGGKTLPKALAAAGGFEAQPQLALPWLPVPVFVGHTGPKLPAPILEVVGDASTPKGRRLELFLQSKRGASQGSVMIEATAGFVGGAVQGTPVPAAQSGEKIGRVSASPWRMLSVRPFPAEGARFAIELSKRDAVQILFSDMTFGLPAEQDAVKSAREEHVVPIHSGDFASAWSVLKVPAWQAVPSNTP